MKTQKILRNLLIALVIAALVSICYSIITLSKNYKVYAETESNNIIIGEAEEDAQEITPYSLGASLSLSINSGDGKVWATVKNDYTIFPGTISVIVQLYCSDTYAESYTQMTLVCANSIGDLDMGKTISTEASTGGAEKFWLARMRYKIDKASWTSKQTAACRISADGEFLGYI